MDTIFTATQLKDWKIKKTDSIRFKGCSRYCAPFVRLLYVLARILSILRCKTTLRLCCSCSKPCFKEAMTKVRDSSTDCIATVFLIAAPELTPVTRPPDGIEHCAWFLILSCEILL